MADRQDITVIVGEYEAEFSGSVDDVPEYDDVIRHDGDTYIVQHIATEYELDGGTREVVYVEGPVTDSD